MAEGLVVVDKPAGMTSHDVVHAARRLFRTKRIGHTGTLDPDATGVLVLCLEQATRLAEYLSASRKHYVTEVRFGVETDTQDASGQIRAERDASHLTEADLLALLPRFRGKIEQTPPMVSAKHHQGKRLYALAREGVEVERAPVPIEIYTLEVAGFAPGLHPVARLEVTCSTGTYIRALAAEIGNSAGVGGMMQSLRRIWVGDAKQTFTLAQAHTLDALQAAAEAGTLDACVLPLTSAVAGWPQFRLTDGQTARIRQGQFLRLAEIAEAERVALPQDDEDAPIALLDGAGELLAVARRVDERIQPVKVLTRHERV